MLILGKKGHKHIQCFVPQRAMKIMQNGGEHDGKGPLVTVPPARRPLFNLEAEHQAQHQAHYNRSLVASSAGAATDIDIVNDKVDYLCVPCLQGKQHLAINRNLQKELIN